MNVRYRYIPTGLVLGSEQICNLRLVGGNNLGERSYLPYSIVLRVRIPEDLELEKWSSDPYSTTEDERTLDELGYDILLWKPKQRRWVVRNEFKGQHPVHISEGLRLGTLQEGSHEHSGSR